jgi:5-methylcytosine-specific restriction protein A
MSKLRLGTLPKRVAILDTSIGAKLGQAQSYGQGRGGRPWRRKRDQVMQRDKFMCQCERCQGKRLPAHEVDHIVPLSQGGTDDPKNLRAVNRECHKAKTAREANGGT